MKILIADRPDSMAPGSDHERQVLLAGLPGAEVVHHPVTDETALHREIADADALLTAYLRVDETLLRAAPRLKIVSINATGWDAVDLEAAHRHGVAVTCVGEYCTHEVADHTLALLLALHRGLRHFIRVIDDPGHWQYQSIPAPRRLRGQTLGIVGLGRIGSDVARKAQAFGLQVIATDPAERAQARAGELGVEMVSRDELLARADIVTNHMDLNETSRDYFDAAAFAALKHRPVFLNTARGSSVVTDALVAALDSGQVSGAGVDVLAGEGDCLKGHPLTGRDNVIITPHSAFASDGSLSDLERIPCENIVHFLRGEHEKVFKRVL